MPRSGASPERPGNTIKTHFEAGSKSARPAERLYRRRLPAQYGYRLFGRGVCEWTRVDVGVAFGTGDAFAEWHFIRRRGTCIHGTNACNEILTVTDEQGELHLSSLMGVGFGHIERQFDLKQMTQEQAADYLWRRFLMPLER